MYLQAPPYPHQAVQLGHWHLGAGLAHVPHLHAALATRVHVLCGAADGDCADHLAMRQRVQLPRMPWDALNAAFWSSALACQNIYNGSGT